MVDTRPLTAEETEVAEKVRLCVNDIVAAINQHPNPAVQTTALVTVLGKIYATEDADLTMSDDVKKFFANLGDRAFQYWAGFVSGEFYDEKPLQ